MFHHNFPYFLIIYDVSVVSNKQIFLLVFENMNWLHRGIQLNLFLIALLLILPFVILKKTDELLAAFYSFEIIIILIFLILVLISLLLHLFCLQSSGFLFYFRLFSINHIIKLKHEFLYYLLCYERVQSYAYIND